jgi:hypothetical protein
MPVTLQDAMQRADVLLVDVSGASAATRFAYSITFVDFAFCATAQLCVGTNGVQNE